MTYCGDGPSFVASVDASRTSLFAIFTEPFACLTLFVQEKGQGSKYMHAKSMCLSSSFLSL